MKDENIDLIASLLIKHNHLPDVLQVIEQEVIKRAEQLRKRHEEAHKAQLLAIQYCKDMRVLADKIKGLYAAASQVYTNFFNAEDKKEQEAADKNIPESYLNGLFWLAVRKGQFLRALCFLQLLDDENDLAVHGCVAGKRLYLIKACRKSLSTEALNVLAIFGETLKCRSWTEIQTFAPFTNTNNRNKRLVIEYVWEENGIEIDGEEYNVSKEFMWPCKGLQLDRDSVFKLLEAIYQDLTPLNKNNEMIVETFPPMASEWALSKLAKISELSENQLHWLVPFLQQSTDETFSNINCNLVKDERQCRRFLAALPHGLEGLRCGLRTRHAELLEKFISDNLSCDPLEVFEGLLPDATDLATLPYLAKLEETESDAFCLVRQCLHIHDD